MRLAFNFRRGLEEGRRKRDEDGNKVPFHNGKLHIQGVHIVLYICALK